LGTIDPDFHDFDPTRSRALQFAEVVKIPDTGERCTSRRNQRLKINVMRRCEDALKG